MQRLSGPAVRKQCCAPIREGHGIGSTWVGRRRANQPIVRWIIPPAARRRAVSAYRRRSKMMNHASGCSGFGEGCAEFLVAVLELVELVVEAAKGEQFLVGALLAELAFVHDENDVGALDC